MTFLLSAAFVVGVSVRGEPAARPTRVAGGFGRGLLRAGCLAGVLLAGIPAASAQRAEIDEEVVLREAEKIERAIVGLVARVQRSTVSVLNYQLVEPAPGQPKIERIVGVGSGVAK